MTTDDALLRKSKDDWYQECMELRSQLAEKEKEIEFVKKKWAEINENQAKYVYKLRECLKVADDVEVYHGFKHWLQNVLGELKEPQDEAK